MSKALAYAATSKTSPMAPITISRRERCSNDVNIEILYCGVCHTDIHTAAATETIPIQEIETAFARMVTNDIKYRFVVDIKSLKPNV
jgi:D-arabinose 1-dehydrogenase-like Zn-dependent alcohol dehydrogenase